ncbi:MAG TPA: hypothetical protein VGK35_00400 [Actinotalea sp.]
MAQTTHHHALSPFDDGSTRERLRAVLPVALSLTLLFGLLLTVALLLGDLLDLGIWALTNR